MEEEVFVRRVTGRDAAEFTALARASVEWHRPWLFPPATDADFADYLDRYDDYNAVGLLACLRSSGAIVGFVNVNNIVRGGFQSASVGYGGFAPGRGYMTAALRLAVRVAFEELELHRLEANIQPGNGASLRLAERAGFRREGFSPRFLFIYGAWRDHERWAITSD